MAATENAIRRISRTVHNDSRPVFMVATMTDSDRESLIDAAYEQMIAASDEAAQRKHWADMIYHAYPVSTHDH